MNRRTMTNTLSSAATGSQSATEGYSSSMNPIRYPNRMLPSEEKTPTILLTRAELEGNHAQEMAKVSG